MWLYNDAPIDENILKDYIGFVYSIANIEDDRVYIGKKLLKFKKTKKVKGRNKRSLVESDWKKYWGSNKSLIADVEELGEQKFIRRILRLCVTKGEMSYYEAKYQFELGVLESNRFYNDWIFVKVHRSHIKKVDFSSNCDIMKLLEGVNDHALAK